MVVKAQTRRQFIEAWSDNKHLDKYCCSDCRDILQRNPKGLLECRNSQCMNVDQFYTGGTLVDEDE